MHNQTCLKVQFLACIILHHCTYIRIGYAETGIEIKYKRKFKTETNFDHTSKDADSLNAKSTNLNSQN